MKNDFAFYESRIGVLCSKIRPTSTGQEYPFATNEASDNKPEASSPEHRRYRQIGFDGTGSEATGRLLFVPAPARRLYRSSNL